jgi:hypothetical protein
MITEEQKKRMNDLAIKVKSNYPELATYEIINRIMTIESITAERAIQGYKLMRSLEVIPTEFVKGGKEVEEKTIKTFFTPVMIDLVKRFGTTIENVRLLKQKPDGHDVELGTAQGVAAIAWVDEFKSVHGYVPSEDSKEKREARAMAKSLFEDKPAPKLRDTIANKLLGLTYDF